MRERKVQIRQAYGYYGTVGRRQEHAHERFSGIQVSKTRG